MKTIKLNTANAIRTIAKVFGFELTPKGEEDKGVDFEAQVPETVEKFDEQARKSVQ